MWNGDMKAQMTQTQARRQGWLGQESDCLRGNVDSITELMNGSNNVIISDFPTEFCNSSAGHLGRRLLSVQPRLSSVPAVRLRPFPQSLRLLM